MPGTSGRTLSGSESAFNEKDAQDGARGWTGSRAAVAASRDETGPGDAEMSASGSSGSAFDWGVVRSGLGTGVEQRLHFHSTLPAAVRFTPLQENCLWLEASQRLQVRNGGRRSLRHDTQ